jgi:hypothetical protein
MRHIVIPARSTRRLAMVVAAVSLSAAVSTAFQSAREAPAGAPSSGRVAPQGEPGQPLSVSGVVVGPDGAPIAGASLYIYQTDREGYYGARPANDNRNPRLKLYLRSDARGAWSFETIKPGSYPDSRVPAHIHFEVTAARAEGVRDRIRGRSVRDGRDARQPGVFGSADRGRAGDGAHHDEVVRGGRPRHEGVRCRLSRAVIATRPGTEPIRLRLVSS